MKTIAEHFRDWESHVFGFGYGTGEEFTIPALKAFLDACPESGNYDHTKLEDAVGPTVAWLLINTLAHADILEYGTSPRFGWLTKEGAALKKYVSENSIVDLISATDFNDLSAYCHPNACNCGPLGYEAGKVCGNPFWRRATDADAR